MKKYLGFVVMGLLLAVLAPGPGQTASPQDSVVAASEPGFALSRSIVQERLSSGYLPAAPAKARVLSYEPAAPAKARVLSYEPAGPAKARVLDYGPELERPAEQ